MKTSKIPNKGKHWPKDRKRIDSSPDVPIERGIPPLASRHKELVAQAKEVIAELISKIQEIPDNTSKGMSYKNAAIVSSAEAFKLGDITAERHIHGTQKEALVKKIQSTQFERLGEVITQIIDSKRVRVDGRIPYTQNLAPSVVKALSDAWNATIDKTRHHGKSEGISM